MMSSEYINGPSTNAPETAMSGYLNKKTRDGRWQKRWFETNGVYLTCKQQLNYACIWR